MKKITISISTLVFILAAFLLFLCADVNAQLKLSIGTPDLTAYPTIRLAVRVEDSTSTFTGLLATDFNLNENGIPMQPLQLSCPSPDSVTPLSVCFLLDRSGSMAYYEDPNKQFVNPDSTKWKNAKAALLLACNKLRAMDAVSLITFDFVVELRQAPTTNKKLLADAVGGINAMGGTYLYDALFAAGKVIGKWQGRRIVFLITDGADNGSTHSQQTAIDSLKQDSVTVFAVGLGVSGAGATALQQIANGTGGKSFLIPTTEQLPSIINELFQNIYISDCSLTYTTNDTCRSGATKNIDLSVATGGNSTTALTQYATPDFRSRMSFVLSAPASMKALQQCEMPLCIIGELRGGEATTGSLLISYDPALLAFKQFRTNASLFVPDFTVTEGTPGELLVYSNGSMSLKGIPYGASDTLGWMTFDALQPAHSNTTELIVHNISITQNCDVVAVGLNSVLTIQTLDGVLPPTGSVGNFFTLQQNHPNPVSSLSGTGTVIEFTLIEKGWATLDVYDFCGRRVARLVDADMPAGTHSVSFTPSQLPKGVYSYILREGPNVAMKKLVWMR